MRQPVAPQARNTGEHRHGVVMIADDNLTEELIETCDTVIETGQRIRSDPGTHEKALAALCNVMARLAAKE
jgi:predicted house-cleaning NTP pyrophosphatase (Maf/HAM1 superfamily)